MSDSDQILLTAGSILLVDWPSTDVPETLAGAGYAVFVKGGPEPDNLLEVRAARREGRRSAHRRSPYARRSRLLPQTRWRAARDYRHRPPRRRHCGVGTNPGSQARVQLTRTVAGCPSLHRRKRARSSSQPA